MAGAERVSSQKDVERRVTRLPRAGKHSGPRFSVSSLICFVNAELLTRFRDRRAPLAARTSREGEVLPCSRHVRIRVVSRGRGDHRHATRRREASRVLHMQGEYIGEYHRALPVFDVLTAMHKSQEVHHPLRVFGR